MLLDVFPTETIPLAADEHGVIRVGKTRVTLDTLTKAFREGATAEEISQQYPSVQLADIYAVIGYYLRHFVEVEAYLHERRNFADQVRRDNELRFSPVGVRARLIARQTNGKV